MNPYWQHFLEHLPWFLDRGEIPRVGTPEPPGSWTPHSADFGRLFPDLLPLLRSAIVTPVFVRGLDCRLFTWPSHEGWRSWLSPLPCPDPPASLFRDHQVLLRSFGGIVERANETCWWVLNHNDALTEREARHDGTFIEAACGISLGIAIELDQFYSIAREVNGNTTLCDRRDGAVVLFAQDHAFDHVERYPGCSEYTLYRLPEAPTFSDWVNVVARQWRQTIDSRPTA